MQIGGDRSYPLTVMIVLVIFALMQIVGKSISKRELIVVLLIFALMQIEEE